MRSAVVAFLLAAHAAAAEFEPRHMFVASYSEAVFEYDANGVLVRTLPTGNALDVAFGPRGHLFVSRVTNVVELDADGATVQTYTDASLGFAAGLAFGPRGSVLVADVNSDQVVEFGGDGSLVNVWANSSEVDAPRCLLFGSDGHLYVGCEVADEVVELAASGDVVRRIATGLLPNPSSLAFSPTGNLLVACNGDDTVKTIDLVQGAIVDSSPASGARGIATAPDGSLVVADAFGDRVQRFTLAGTALVPAGEIAVPAAIALAGVAYSPDRFRFEVSGKAASEPGVLAFDTKGKLSLARGSAVAVLDFDDGDPFGSTVVLHGVDVIDAESKRLFFHGTQLLPFSTAAGLWTGTIEAKGKFDDAGAWIGKSVKASLQYGKGGEVRKGKVESTKKLN